MMADNGFALKRWVVTVHWASGNDTSSDVVATTRGRALADTWRCDAFSSSTFGEFLKFARCTRSHHMPDRWGDPITILGKAAFFVDSNQQYVQFAYPDSGVVLNAHPYDVLPESYRPHAYRSAATLNKETADAGA